MGISVASCHAHHFVLVDSVTCHNKWTKTSQLNVGTDGGDNEEDEDEED